MKAKVPLSHAPCPPWSPPPLIANPLLRWGLLLMGGLYLLAAFSTLEINWERVSAGMSRSLQVFAGFLQPDFASRWWEIQSGVLESLTMTVVATVIGTALSVPIGLGAARTLTPLPVYLFCRGMIALARTFQEVIIAIFFVVLVGFGPLAGVLTLSFASIGFLAKLLAEEIEAIQPAPLEAIRTTGASWLQLVTYAVMPQVLPRLVGLITYRFDINLRESAIVGVVGAGGIGATLQTAFSRYDFDVAAAILLIIIGLVWATEVGAGAIRRRIQ